MTGVTGTTGAPAPSVRHDPLPGFAGCSPTSVAADSGGHYYLAVDCRRKLLPGDPETATASPGPPVVAGPPQPATGPIPPTTPPVPVPALSPALLPPGMVTPIADDDAGGVVVRVENTALPRVGQASGVHVAAGDAGRAYLTWPSAGGALQVEALVTTDQGRSFSTLASPRPESHFVMPVLAAAGARVLFGAVELDPFPNPPEEFSARLWRLPHPGSDEVPSLTLPATFSLAIAFDSDGVRAHAVTSVTNDRTRLFRIYGSNDGGETFGSPRTHDLPDAGDQLAFARDDLFVATRPQAQRHGIFAVPLGQDRAVESFTDAWEPAEDLEALLADAHGGLAVFARRADGTIVVRRLVRADRRFVIDQTFGPADPGIAVAVLPDDPMKNPMKTPRALVAFTWDKQLIVTRLP
jgi:hypothetical protein